ncbi:MAG: hypothetical protein N2235_22000 [Fischerella sp.]|nr:hypothetical protein [Fischerella sp.]
MANWELGVSLKFMIQSSWRCGEPAQCWGTSTPLEVHSLVGSGVGAACESKSSLTCRRLAVSSKERLRDGGSLLCSKWRHLGWFPQFLCADAIATPALSHVDSSGWLSV